MARACAAGPDAILLPKVETPGDVRRAAELIERHGAPERTRIWAMMETPRGSSAPAPWPRRIPGSRGSCSAPTTSPRIWAPPIPPTGVPLIASLGLCLLAARAEGLICVDGVHNALQDAEGLRAACVQGRDMGFDGKTLVHPDQIAIANEVFAPSAESLALAAQQVAAFEAAEARGEGVAVVNGRIVENLHVASARRLLARAAAIAALDARSGEADHVAARPRPRRLDRGPPVQARRTGGARRRSPPRSATVPRAASWRWP